MKAKIIGAVKLDFTLLFEVNEQELRALDALTGYGFEAFKKVFYEKLGTHYLQPHEAGLKSFFETIGKLHFALHEMDEIHKKTKEIKNKLHPTIIHGT